LKDAKQNRDDTQATLDQLKLRLAEKSKVREQLAAIREVAQVFHWNNLPKAVSQANLELLVTDVNENLALFNSPFVVEADQDLTFNVFFPGQSAVKARQLSGGQKVILAIAFRAALDRVFGHDVGMLFLDEPTAGLDADNMNYFHEAIQRLAQKVGTDRQLVVITHEHEFNESFDRLISITRE
jgi:DNA repair exonuclease SbcCD ATPase subunit